MNHRKQPNTIAIWNYIILIYLQNLIGAGILDIWYHNATLDTLSSSENLNWT